jgi:hypothetical protein
VDYPPAITGATEEYNGTTWATSPPGSLNTARQISRRLLVLQTAGLAFGGKLHLEVTQEQQNNIMELVGQLHL